MTPTLLLTLLLTLLAGCTTDVVSLDDECDECVADSDVDTDTDTDSDSDADSDADSDTDSDADVPTDADGDGYDTAPVDCDDSDATVYPGAPEVCDDKDNDCDGYVDEGDVCEDEPQLSVTITTPGANVYGSMICHVEYIEEDLDNRLEDGDWGSWERSWVENWVSETTLESDPGIIDGIRLNCTLCPDELTLAEEPSGTTAEAMGCTWTGYGSSSSESRINGAVATWYFDETFSAEPLYVSGGTSVLVDLR